MPTEADSSQSHPRSNKIGIPAQIKTVHAVVLLLISHFWTLYSFRPSLDVEPYRALLPGDPYKQGFLITNKGKLSAKDVVASCAIRETEFEEGYQADAWAFANKRSDRLRWMAENERLSVLCPQHLQVFRDPSTKQGFAQFSSEADVQAQSVTTSAAKPLAVNSALAEILVEYKLLVAPMKRSMRFVGRRDFENRLVWFPVGSSENLLTKRPQRTRFTLQSCEKPWREGTAYSVSIGDGFDAPRPCPE